MRRVDVVEPKNVITYPHASTVVVLRVDGKNTGRAHEQVVDVLRSRPDRHSVKRCPLWAQASEDGTDMALTLRTNEPRASVWREHRAILCSEGWIVLFCRGLNLKTLLRHRVARRA